MVEILYHVHRHDHRNVHRHHRAYEAAVRGQLIVQKQQKLQEMVQQ